MHLKSLQTINSRDRISSVDVFRAFAILPVVIYHFNSFIPYGYLGVDLFFVISGLLVGSILIRKFKKNEKIIFWKFILQRGFKIWPSYYCFLLVGTILAYIFYRYDKPEYIINGAGDSIRYLFFFQNYTGAPYHLPFDHVWSLCVEEHFYILLPIVFLILTALFKNSRNLLILSVVGLIASGIVFKFISVYFMPGISTYSTTHNRIDALGWGVLLGVFTTYFGDYLKKLKWLPLVFIVGLLLFALNLVALLQLKSAFYQDAIFYSVSPFCFFLMLLGLYYHDFSSWKPIRFIAYYSYNWYLWHPLFVAIVGRYIGINWWGLLVYMIVSFTVAVFFTILVEEKFLKHREAIINKIFRKRQSAIA